MKPQLKSVKPLELYKLFVEFADGTKGFLNLEHLAGKGVFKAWDEEKTFFDVYISPESKAITWPGELDIDTYNVYFKIKGITPDQYFHLKTFHATDI